MTLHSDEALPQCIRLNPLEMSHNHTIEFG